MNRETGFSDESTSIAELMTNDKIVSKFIFSYLLDTVKEIKNELSDFSVILDDIDRMTRSISKKNGIPIQNINSTNHIYREDMMKALQEEYDKNPHLKRHIYSEDSDDGDLLYERVLKISDQNMATENDLQLTEKEINDLEEEKKKTCSL